jgi:hypothetical protein
MRPQIVQKLISIMIQSVRKKENKKGVLKYKKNFSLEKECNLGESCHKNQIFPIQNNSLISKI